MSLTQRQPQKITQKSSKEKRDQKGYPSLPKQGFWIIVGAVVVSFLFHFASMLNFQIISKYLNQHKKITYRQPVKIKYKTPPKPNRSDQDEPDKRIVETPLEKTKRPEESRYKSFQDHQTDKETKTSKITRSRPAADAAIKQSQRSKSKKQANRKSSKPKTPKLSIESPDGLAINADKRKRRKAYQKLIPTQNDLARLMDEGYQEYLDDELIEAERIDINTTEYRYMGYFTNMRKAIELVWNYPMDAARRGMQGEVGVEFIINKDGSLSRVRVIKSSGYKILDDAIVEALELAAPFSPLPDSLDKERLLVTGSFRYILSSFFAGAH